MGTKDKDRWIAIKTDKWKSSDATWIDKLDVSVVKYNKSISAKGGSYPYHVNVKLKSGAEFCFQYSTEANARETQKKILGEAYVD